MLYYNKKLDKFVCIISILLAVCSPCYFILYKNAFEDIGANKTLSLLMCGSFAIVILISALISAKASIMRLTKSSKLSAEVSKSRKIICQGPANFSTPGWGILSVDAFEFYSFSGVSKSKNFFISIDDIKKVTSEGNRKLIIDTESQAYTFKVEMATNWEETILKEL